MHKPMTKPQTQMFWRLFSRSCQSQGIPSDERDAYRKTIMWEECHVQHLADLDCCGDFDRIMIRLALDAEDYELAARFDSGDERRMAHLVAVLAFQVMQLHGSEETEAAAYVRRVLHQAGFPCRLDGAEWWLDLPASDLMSLFQMLDTHRRRLLQSLGWSSSLKFNACSLYRRTPAGVLLVEAPADPRLPFRVHVA